MWNLYVCFAQIAIFIVLAVKESSLRMHVTEGEVSRHNESSVVFTTRENRRSAGLWSACALMRVWVSISKSFLRGFVCIGHFYCGLEIRSTRVPRHDPYVRVFRRKRSILCKLQNSCVLAWRWRLLRIVMKASIFFKRGPGRGRRGCRSHSVFLYMLSSRLVTNIAIAFLSSSEKLNFERVGL